MKFRFFRIVSIIMVMITFLSAVPMNLISAVNQVVPVANAADLYQTEINSKISALKNTFKQNEYFSGNDGTYVNLTKSSPTLVCTGYSTYNGLSCVANGYCGYGGYCTCKCGTYYYGGYPRTWQCWAFACQIGYNVFGSDPYMNWNTHKDISKVCVGDIIRFSWSADYQPHSIFVIEINGNTVKYADCNASGPCKIDWTKSITKERLQTLLNHRRDAEFAVYHAPNNKYGECNHNSSYTGAPYVCSSCGAVNPAKIVDITDAEYEVISNNAPYRKGPYETCDKIGTLAKGTIVTVTHKMTNSKDNLWYKLDNNAWIFSEHLKKFTSTYSDITDGDYRIKSASNGQYLIVDAGDGSNGNNVSVWPLDTGATEQKWYVLEDSLGFKIHTKLSSGRVLNPYGYSVVAGNNVNIWNFIGGDATLHWKFEKVSGGYVIRNVSVSSCVLTVENGHNVKVDTYRSGDKTQIWILESLTQCSHVYNSGKVTTVATCTSTGIKTYSCTKCGSTKTETIAATGHNWVCDVFSTDEYCTKCGKRQAGVHKPGFEELPTPDTEITLGDIDGDNKITAADARLVLRAAVGLESFSDKEIYAADVDKNGSVSSADARLILRAAVGLENLQK